MGVGLAVPVGVLVAAGVFPPGVAADIEVEVTVGVGVWVAVGLPGADGEALGGVVTVGVGTAVKVGVGVGQFPTIATWSDAVAMIAPTGSELSVACIHASQSLVGNTRIRNVSS